MIGINEVRRRVALGLLVRHALDDPIGVHLVPARGRVLGVSQVVLVGGEDDAADAWHGLELLHGGVRPRGAVVGADVGAPFPCPPEAAEHYHALHPAGY